MRVLILNQFYVPDLSPTAHLAASLAEDRAARGDEVTVLTSKGGYVAPNARTAVPEHKNLRVLRLWTPQFGKQTHLRRLVDYASFYSLAMMRALTLPKQDVIVALTTPPFIALAGVLHKAAHPQTRLILWNMDCYPDVIERCGLIPQGGVVSSMLRRINRLIFERIDHLVGLDTAMIELLRKKYAPATLKCSVVPNWERASMFPASSNGNSAHTPQFTTENPFKIIYLGNAGYGHNFDAVLDAAEMLRGAPVQFDFYGGGARWGGLVDDVAARKLGNMRMHGYVAKEDTPKLMATAHCALITLRDDALGVMSPSKLHSNLAMGLPVIYVGPEKSNVDDAIRRFGCGISLRHGQSAELAAFVRTLMTNEGAYEAFHASARRAFDEAYCDERTLPMFDAVIRNGE
ncbi:MAG TPA: glycosyltransferase family 4 protein [Planctomycetota bacterium]|nr:glycosyltransferase family 4 protein [Planctomycetota bacterium]